MQIVRIQFKTKWGDFDDKFEMPNKNFANIINQLRFEKQWTEANIKSNTIKVDGDKFNVEPTFFKDYVNFIDGDEGFRSFEKHEG